MADTSHFEHHRLESLRTKRRFRGFNALAVAVIVGATIATRLPFFDHGSHASIAISGTVRITGGNTAGIGGVGIDVTCDGNPDTYTDGNGNWSYPAFTGFSYCVRLVPVNIPGLSAATPANGSYEYQVAGQWCNHPNSCNQYQNAQDHASDSGFDYTYNNVAPVGSTDAASCSSVDGWGGDPNSPGSTLAGQVLIDGNGVGTLGNAVYRGDVNALGYSGNHGFDWPMNPAYYDNKQHTAYAQLNNTYPGPVTYTNQVTFGPCKAAAPSAPSLNGVSGATSSSLNLSWSASSFASPSSLLNYAVYNSSGRVLMTTQSTSATVSGLAACTGYSYFVLAINDQGSESGNSNVVSGSTTGCAPAATPKPAPVPVKIPVPIPGKGSVSATPAPTSTKAASGSTKTTTSSGSGSSAPATPDTTPPSTPANVLGSVNGAIVQLTWDMASDNSSGIAGYTVERSLDQQTWAPVGNETSDVTLTDSGASYGVHYYYRVQAIDNAGNKSGYGTADATTAAFSANTSAGSDTLFVSDDNMTSVDLPPGAIDADSECDIAGITDNTSSLVIPKLSVVVGPYLAACKKSTGETVDSYAKSGLAVIATTKDLRSKYGKFYVYAYNAQADKWVVQKAVYNSKKGTYSFNTIGSSEYALLAAKRAPFPWTPVLLVLILILGAGGVLFWRVRQVQKYKYDEYLRSKYYNG